MIYWVELHARTGQGDEVLHVLQALCTTTRVEPGALMYGFHRVSGDADRIVLYERYRDEAAAAFHMESGPVQEALHRFDGLLRVVQEFARARLLFGGDLAHIFADLGERSFAA